MVEKLLKPFLILLSSLSTNLPQTIKDFDLFYRDLITLFDLPSGNQTKQAFASMLMHLPADKSKAPKKYFAKCLKKALVNQAAFQVLGQIREDEKQQQKAKDEQDGPRSNPPIVDER